MREQLLQLLRPVRRRLILQHTYRSAFSGLVVGAVLTLLYSVISWTTGITRGVPIEFVCLIPAAITAFSAFSTLPDWTAAARAVDARFDLKDRILTALQLSDDLSQPLAQLQVRDAVYELEEVFPEDVVQIAAPIKLRRACVAMIAVAAVLPLVPLQPHKTSADIPQPEYVNAETVQTLRDEVTALQKITSDSDAPELQTLVAELQKAISQLDPEQTTAREMLETVSDIQQQLNNLSQQLKTEAVDRRLQDVADALSVSDAFQQTADALKKSALQTAADQLKKVDPENMPPEQAIATAEDLQQAADKAQQQLPELAETLEDLADAIAADLTTEIKQQALDLAEQLETQQQLKSLQQSLNAQMESLNQQKKLALNSNSEGNGMAANATGVNTRKGKSDRRSDASSRKAGGKSSGNPLGEKTRLDASRQMARLQGQLNESGTMDKETTIETESDETASRPAVEIYNDYRRLSEAVLETEPVPLGQKEFIRRYFQQIRPAQSAQE